MDISDVVGEFVLAKRANGRAARTIEDYGRVLTPFAEWCQAAGVGAGGLSRRKVREYLVLLRGRGLAEGTVAIHVRNLRTFFRWSHVEGMLAENFATVIEAPRQVRRHEDPLTAAEIGSILAACAGDELAARDRAIVWMFIDTGLRIGEMERLDRAALQLGEDGRAWMRIYAPKTRAYRFVIVGEYATRALTEYLEERGDDDLGAMWRNRRGGRLASQGIYRMIKRRAEVAGLRERVHPHLFRKTFSTQWLNNGGDVERLRVLAGWSPETAAQMLRVYVASRVDDLKAAHAKASPGDGLGL